MALHLTNLNILFAQFTPVGARVTRFAFVQVLYKFIVANPWNRVALFKLIFELPHKDIFVVIMEITHLILIFHELIELWALALFRSEGQAIQMLIDFVKIMAPNLDWLFTRDVGAVLVQIYGFFVFCRICE